MNKREALTGVGGGVVKKNGSYDIRKEMRVGRSWGEGWVVGMIGMHGIHDHTLFSRNKQIKHTLQSEFLRSWGVEARR